MKKRRVESVASDMYKRLSDVTRKLSKFKLLLFHERLIDGNVIFGLQFARLLAARLSLLEVLQFNVPQCLVSQLRGKCTVRPDAGVRANAGKVNLLVSTEIVLLNVHTGAAEYGTVVELVGLLNVPRHLGASIRATIPTGGTVKDTLVMLPFSVIGELLMGGEGCITVGTGPMLLITVISGKM